MNIKVRWIREGRKIWEELEVRKNMIEIYSMKNLKLIKDKKPSLMKDQSYTSMSIEG